MSAFEVALTPPRIKNARKVSASREPTDVVLGLFSAKSIVTFEDIPVTKTARRTLHIHNPTDDVLKVQVTKTLNADSSATLEWTSNEIPARSCIAMEIVWSPIIAWSTRETIQFCDNRNFKKDVSVIMKSIDKTQNKKNMTRNSLSNKSHANEYKLITKKLTLKSPSPRTKQQRAKLSALSMANRMTNTKETGFRAEMKKVLGSKNQSDDFPAITIFESCTMSTKNVEEKENTDVEFDSIKFTPVRKDKGNASNVEYLASLPTPNGNAAVNRSTFFQLDKSPTDLFCNLNETETILLTPCKINDQTTTFSDLQTPLGHTEVDHSNYFDNVHEQIKYAMEMTPADVSFSAQKASDIGIEPKKFNFEDPSLRMEVIIENTELNITSTINRTHVVPSPIAHPQLSVIEEEHSRIEMSETYVKHTAHHLTYNLEETAEPAAENLARDVRLVGTPLKKKFLSMKELNDSKNNMSLEQKILKNNQGSMPNLHKLEAVKSIENNRYFYQSIEKDLQQPETIQEKEENNEHDDEENLGDTSICSMKSTVSVQSVAFQEHEILAQSSQFNLNEIGRSKVFKFPTFDRPTNRVNDTKKVMTNKHLSASSPTINKTPANNIQKTKHSQSIRDIRSESSSAKGSRTSINSSYTNGLNTSSSTHKKRIRDDDLSKRSFNKQSPPKRVCMDNDSPKTNKGQAFRTKTWGSVLPKKFRVPSVPPHRLLLNRPEEKRVILFDPELHMRGFINPDPFAATTVMDPFLSATMYLDERSVDKHEIQFKKWLNALVTLPAEMDENPNQTLDIAKLFNEVKSNKDCTLAPTKETASANYLTKYRMNSLRTAAIALYTSKEMHESLSKLLVHIERKAIHIRQDRNLHLDVVLQRSILELLLNFNPLWLRIGLEVVFGEIIFMHNSHDMISLSAFILNRLFRDRYLEAKHPKVYAQGDIYAEHIKKHTLKKFLCLLYFLDVAKNKKIIKHNPCLFLKKSEYKETKDILLKFSSSLLGNIGDVQRDLKRIGIVLTHKQTYIDEFDYAFRNLAIDLRDGVRLTKVMEIILLRDDMTSQLRVPAISRIQRVHNVGVALKALENADFNLTGKITAMDIADGHREKTLSLLWQIIYRFRAPKFHAAAAVIQTWWQKNWLSVCIRRRIGEKIERARNQAASKIQMTYRGYRGRQYAKRYKEERSAAALTIQRYVRRYLAMKEFVFRIRAIIIIQRWYRNHKVAETSRQQFIQMKHSCCIIQNWYRKILLARKIERLVPIARQVQEESKLTVKSAISIQRKFRSYIITKQVRTEFLELKRNVIVVQQRFKALFAMRQQRAIYLEQRNTIIHVQQVFRANVAMKKERIAFMKLKMSTCQIQIWYRACQLRDIERKRYSELKNAVTVIQRQYRQIILVRKTQQQFLKLKKAAICIQNHYRAQKAMQTQRNKYLKIRNNVIVIQQRLRATILMKEIRTEYLSTLCTIITLQRRFRAKCLAQKYKKEYENVQNAVCVIQTRYRAHLEMRKQKTIYEKLQSTIAYIQTKYRAKRLGRQVRNEFIEYRAAVVTVQQRFRAKQIMQIEKVNYLRIRAATIVIQCRWRAQIMKRKMQSEYLKMKNAAMVVQHRYRALIAMRYQQNEYLQLKEFTISVQRRFRANILMQKDQMSYLKLRQSCIVIQKRYRANMLMRQEQQAFELLKKYTIIIQNRFRANRLAEDTQYEYLKMKGAAMTIQQHFRAYLVSKKVQRTYQKWRNAAICLQKHFRNKKLMEMHKVEYLTIKSAAITIQRRFRAQRFKKMQQHEYQAIRNAAISIQNRFRANILMRKQRADYLKLKKAAICFQQRYRAKHLMKEQRTDYVLKRCCTIYIQRRYRELIETRHQRVQYLIKRRSVITIQRFVRGYLQMKHERQQFISIRTSTIIIQRRFHAHRQMILVREQYVTKIVAVRKIQTFIRSYLMMKSQREEFSKLRTATICLQQRYRALRLMQQQQRNYLTLQNAVICIQRRYRSNLQMKDIQNQYKLLKCLVICVQRKYRARLQMKIERESYIRLKWATCYIQQKYRANKLAINQRTTFIHLKKATLGVQAQIRGYLARKRFQMLMTPELIEKRRQTKAAKVIQSFWRGYRIRKTRTAKLRAICEKSKMLQKTVSEKNMVKHRVLGIIKFLKQRYNVKDALAILRELEFISLTIPHTLIVDSVFIGNFCYGIMSQAIRSEIDKQLISLCCRVLLNLARYKPTQQNVFQIDHFETVAQILYRWCDKDCDIFNVLCTVLYVFIQSPEINQRIREFMVTREAIFLLRETKKLVARKERMRAITPPAWMPVLTPKERRIMPLLETNFGVRQLTKNYIFNCSVFGFDTILSEMNIII